MRSLLLAILCVFVASAAAQLTGPPAPIQQGPRFRPSVTASSPASQPAPNVGATWDSFWSEFYLGSSWAVDFLTAFPAETCDTSFDADVIDHCAPPLYFGNSFNITGIVPHNDTTALLTALWNSSVPQYFNNSSPPNETYSILLRVIGVVRRAYYNGTGNPDILLPGNSIDWYPAVPGESCDCLTICPNDACFSHVLTSTPSYVGWQVAGNDTFGFADFGGADSNGINPQNINLWASNPSAYLWINPASPAFNASNFFFDDDIYVGPVAQIYPQIPVANDIWYQWYTGDYQVELHWQVACQIDSSGADCAPAPPGVTCGNETDLYWFDNATGLCWQDVQPPNGNFSFFAVADQFTRPLDRVMVAPRKLILMSSNPSDLHFDFYFVESQTESTLYYFDSDSDSNSWLPIFVLPGVASVSSPITVSLPLNPYYYLGVENYNTSHFSIMEDSYPYPYGVENDFTRRFTPGPDNSGGTLTVTIQTAYQIFSDPTIPPVQLSNITMSSPVTLSALQPSGDFTLSDITWTPGVDHIYVYLQINESNPSVFGESQVSETDAGLGIYNNGAYTVPAVRLQLAPVLVQLDNWFDTEFAVVPMVGSALDACDQPYQYTLELSNSPADLGLSSVTVNFTLAGGLQFYQCSSSKRQQSSALDAFVLTGSQHAFNFVLVPPSTPTVNEAATVTWGNVTSDPPLPSGAFLFNFSGVVQSFEFVANTISVTATNNFGFGDEDSQDDDGPFVNEPYYIQFQWTPPTVNGFAIEISGQYTTWPSNAASLTENNTVATFVVPQHATGFLAGPFVTAAPPNLPHDEPTVTLPFAIGLVTNPADDSSWYTLESNVVLITFTRHQYFFVDDWQAWAEDGMWVPVWTTGQSTPPLCIGVISTQVFTNDSEIWITPVSNPPWFIFEPVNPVSGAVPNNSLVLTEGMPFGCFTVRFDTNRQLDTFLGSAGVEDSHTGAQDIVLPSITVSYIAAGPGDTQLQQTSGVLNAPEFYLSYATINVQMVPTSSADIAGFDGGIGVLLHVGDAVQLLVTVDVPPSAFSGNVTYQLTVPGSSSPYVGTFSPGGTQQHIWTVTFDQVLPVDEGIEGEAMINYAKYWYSILGDYDPYSEELTSSRLLLSGPAAEFYQSEIFAEQYIVFPRLVTLNLDLALTGGYYESLFYSELIVESSEVTVGPVLLNYPTPLGAVVLRQPVLVNLTVTPQLISSGVAGRTPPLVFTPSSFTFVPGGDTEMAFSVTGQLLGTYEYSFALSGADRDDFMMVHPLLISYFLPEASQVLDPYWLSSPPTLSLTVIQRPLELVGLGVLEEFQFTAGLQYGPFVVSLAEPLLPGETLEVSLQSSTSDLQFSPSSTFTFAGSTGTSFAVFSVRWVPNVSLQQYAASNETEVPLNVYWAIIGGNTTLYQLQGQTAVTLTGVLRYAEVSTAYDGVAIIGVRYSGFVQLYPQTPAPDALNVLLQASSNVQFYEPGSTTPMTTPMVTFSGPNDGTIKYFEFVVVTSSVVVGAPFEGGYSLSVTPVIDGHSVAAPFFLPGSPAYVFPMMRQITIEGLQSSPSSSYVSEYYDFSSTGIYLTENNGSGVHGNVFMLNRESPQQIMQLSTPPGDQGLSVTLYHPYLSFNPSPIAFAAGQISAAFTVTPTGIPPSDNTVMLVDVELTGADAPYYYYSQVVDALSGIAIVPELGFSSIPALPTDGSVSGLSVWVVNITSPFPFSADNSFTLTARPWIYDHDYLAPGVLFQPSTLQFTATTLTPPNPNGPLSQTYSIQHVRPSSLLFQNFYNIQWLLRLEGADDDEVFEEYVDMTYYVPPDAQRVALTRYQIEPIFPNVLKFGWQDASFNLSRAPWSTITFTPNPSLQDGQGAGYGGHESAGGRLVFDPAVISFAPGQVVSSFKVQAIPGNRESQVYYRVNWAISGQEDDLVNFIEYNYFLSDDAGSLRSFATWHVAPAAERFCPLGLGLSLLVLLIIVA